VGDEPPPGDTSVSDWFWVLGEELPSGTFPAARRHIENQPIFLGLDEALGGSK